MSISSTRKAKYLAILNTIELQSIVFIFTWLAMFKTHKSTEVGFYGLFGESQHWRLVERNLFRPWFCVTLVQDDDGLDLHNTLMPADVQMLVEILNQQGDGLIVTDVLVMMPAWMTQSDRWTLERLVELRSRDDPDCDPVYFFVLENGSIFPDSGHADGHILSMSEINDAQIIYQRKQKG